MNLFTYARDALKTNCSHEHMSTMIGSSYMVWPWSLFFFGWFNMLRSMGKTPSTCSEPVWMMGSVLSVQILQSFGHCNISCSNLSYVSWYRNAITNTWMSTISRMLFYAMCASLVVGKMGVGFTGPAGDVRCRKMQPLAASQPSPCPSPSGLSL